MQTNSPVSEFLRQLQGDLNATLSENGHIHLDRVAAARLVAHLGNLAVHAANQELVSLADELSRRTFADRLMLLAEMHHLSGNVLRLMRPDSAGGENVIAFRPRTPAPSGPSTPPGGDAA